MDNVYEIRLRVNAPLIVVYQGTEYFLTREGQFTHRRENAYLVSAQEVKETMGYVSSYSLYAFEDEVRQGFITIQGGHRVGIAGKAVMEGDKVKSVIYFLCKPTPVPSDKRLRHSDYALSDTGRYHLSHTSYISAQMWKDYYAPGYYPPDL